MTRRSCVLASGNAGKIAELSAALEPLHIDLRPLSDWTDQGAEETGDSFVANALLKARHAAQISGHAALADDSGLAVHALDGAPGVRSARYAGPQASDTDNNRRLLQELAGVDDRRAYFCCVLAWVENPDDPAPLIAQGRWQGEILDAPRGDGGFGYDPLFLDPRSGLTAAQMSRAEKLARSHRGQAVKGLIKRLKLR